MDMRYPPPLDQLLRLGQPAWGAPWHDYVALGIGPEHVAALVRMLQDEALTEAGSDSSEVWAPAHAWRALGQLRAEAAIAPLLDLLPLIDEDDDDLVATDVPEVLAMIGPAALKPLEEYLVTAREHPFAQVAASEALRRLAEVHPESREAVVAALRRKLERFGEFGASDTVNGFVIGDLVDLKAVEAAPLMQRAFAAGAVDTMVQGDWRDVAKRLGVPVEPGAAVSPSAARKRHRKRQRRS